MSDSLWDSLAPRIEGCLLLKQVFFTHTLPETNMAPQKMPSQNENGVFQLSIFKAKMLVSERVVPEYLPRLSKSVKCQSPFMVGFDIPTRFTFKARMTPARREVK